MTLFEVQTFLKNTHQNAMLHITQIPALRVHPRERSPEAPSGLTGGQLFG